MKARFDIEELPQPFLAGYLDPSYAGLTDASRKILAERPLAYGCDFSLLQPAERKEMWELHRAFLKAAHLPEDYDQLGKPAQADARKSVFGSYWDPAKPAELVCSVRNAVAAAFLWNEHYEKGCVNGRGIYTMRDGQFKYDLVAATLSPPLVPSEPAKTAFHVVRGGTKTTTIVRQLAKMIPITRPYSQILIVEANLPRNNEEIQKIAFDIETNERIHEDFGGDGELFSNRSNVAYKWSSNQLDFRHFPACGILGYSFTAKQLGRHPLMVLLDDIENIEDVKKGGAGRKPNILDRRQIFQLIFKTFKHMLYPGGKLVWFGNARPGTCLETALADPKDPTTVHLADKRFDDWRKLRFTMIYTDEDGNRKSRMPDHTSVKGYDLAKITSGASVVGSEMDGVDVPDGECVLTRNPYTHGYMHAVRTFPMTDVIEEYFLDLHTWKEMPWEVFLKSLSTVSACDPANSQEADADFGATATVGTDPAGVKYVLDVDMTKIPADKWPERAYSSAAKWGCDRIAWETVAMQTLVLGRARELATALEDEGCTEVPVSVPVPNGQRNKHLRVLSVLGPLHRNSKIRYPRWTPVEGPDGVTHYPAECGKLEMWNELFQEIDTYTSEGSGTRYDDPIDALQMAIRAGGNRVGNEGKEVNEIQESIERWNKRGIQWNPNVLPVEYHQEPQPTITMERGGTKKRNSYFEVDPYG